MTIYNYGSYVGSPGGTAGHNSTALTTMFGDMASASPIGGVAFIPQDEFQVNASTAGFTLPDQCNIIGSAGGGKSTGGTDFYHFVINGTGAQTFLNCPTGAGHTPGGKYFRNLAFQWVSSTSPTDTCIFATSSWNVRAIDCTFTDCPIVLNGGAESSTLEQCTIQYTQGPNSTTAVILAAAQCGVIGPSVFSQTSPASGPTGCVCISIQGPAEHTIIANTQIYEWNVGIDFTQKAGAEYTHITNCEIECWQNALNLSLPARNVGSGTHTAGIKVVGCVLAKASDSTDGHPIVNIDANLSFGNTNNQLNDISLLDCTVYSMAPAVSGQHGLGIASGSNIKVIGGTYSNNGTGGGAGIAITGACSDVQIIGVNLQPSYPGSPNVHNQTYALLVSGGPTGSVLVSNCDMTGYSSPVHVTGTTPTELIITNCSGYNDQNTALNGGMAPLTSVNAATCSTPYFGPSIITWTHNVSVTVQVFGTTYTAASGIIFLPSPYDSFSLSVSPLIFSWIGK